MKTKLLLIITVLSLILAHSATAQEICLIHGEECVHYSVKQDIRALQCLENEQFKDSIIVTKDSIIVVQSEFIESTGEKIDKLDRQLAKSQADFKSMKKKRRNSFFIGGGFGILATLMVIMAIK